jgi:hypothetical protein
MKIVKMLAPSLALAMVTGAAQPVDAADESRVKAATRSVETGAKKIGAGRVGEGVEETAKGIGRTVVEGAKFTGEKLKESGRAAEPEAKHAWGNVRNGAIAVGQSVRNFFRRLFTD